MYHRILDEDIKIFLKVEMYCDEMEDEFTGDVCEYISEKMENIRSNGALQEEKGFKSIIFHQRKIVLYLHWLILGACLYISTLFFMCSVVVQKVLIYGY